MDSDALQIYLKAKDIHDDIKIIKWAAAICAVGVLVCAFSCGYWTLFAWSEMDKWDNAFKGPQKSSYDREKEAMEKRYQDSLKKR